MSDEALQGLSALEDDLAQLPARIAKAAVQRVLRRAGAALRQAWSDNARIRKSDRGGHGPPGMFHFSLAVSSRISRAALRNFVATNSAPAAIAWVGPTKSGYPEALTEEFGAHTNHHNEEANFPGRRAWEAEKDATVTVIAEMLGPEIEKTQNRFFKRTGG